MESTECSIDKLTKKLRENDGVTAAIVAAVQNLRMQYSLTEIEYLAVLTLLSNRYDDGALPSNVLHYAEGYVEIMVRAVKGQETLRWTVQQVVAQALAQRDGLCSGQQSCQATTAALLHDLDSSSGIVDMGDVYCRLMGVILSRTDARACG